MKWAYDITGAEPIIKDIPAYDAATLVNGELLMLSTNSGFPCAVTGIVNTVGGTMAVDVIGLCLETKTTSGSVHPDGSAYATSGGSNVSVATAMSNTAAVCYVKTIINPFAVYRAEVNQDDAFSVAASAATAEVQVTGVGASSLDGSWIYFSASAGPNYGELRRVIVSATAATLDMTSAVSATITTADTVTLIQPKLSYSNVLDDTATMISQTTVGQGTATNLRVVESYINKNEGFEILKPGAHDGVKVGSSNAALTKFYNDIVCKDHIFGAQE